MFLSFRMGQAAEGPARGQRLCDIDPEELVNHVSKNREVLARRKYTDNLAFSVCIMIGIFSPCQDFPIFGYVI